MGKQTTYHTTGLAELQFAMLVTNQKTGKAFANKQGTEKYSVRVLLNENDSAISHIKSINEAKVDTKTNAKLQGTGKLSISFDTDYAPKVIGMDGTELTGRDVPFFNGLKDKATAVITYSVIDYGNKQLIRLAKVEFKSLELAPREAAGESSVDDIRDQLKSL